MFLMRRRREREGEEMVREGEDCWLK